MTTQTLTAAVDTFALASDPDASHNTLSYLTVQQGAALAFMYFPITGQPQGSTLVSAILTVNTLGVWPAATVTAQAVAELWNPSQVTWGNQPALSGLVASVAVPAIGAGTQSVALDVTAQITAQITAGQQYGLAVGRSDAGASANLYAHEDYDYAPTLALTWAVTPLPPSSLSPSGGRAVGTPTPTVTLNGASDVTAVQVQVDATVGDFSAPVFDSGLVPPTGGNTLDLSTTTYAGIDAGVDVSARAQYSNSSGILSGWSPVSHMTYQPLPVVTWVNPPPETDGIVLTDTPLIAWDLGGATQIRYDLTIGPADSPTTISYQASASTSTTAARIPPGVIHDSSPQLVTLHVTDDVDREAVPGYPL